MRVIPPPLEAVTGPESSTQQAGLEKHRASFNPPSALINPPSELINPPAALRMCPPRGPIPRVENPRAEGREKKAAPPGGQTNGSSQKQAAGRRYSACASLGAYFLPDSITSPPVKQVRCSSGGTRCSETAPGFHGPGAPEPLPVAFRPTPRRLGPAPRCARR